jgi:N-acetylglucosamine kinase-like BadF-type ATPase
MEKQFFLGIADNDRFASAVVGDLSGRIIATSVGGSVNHHYWGMEQARENFRDLVCQTIGLDGCLHLAGACFTYKADFAVSDWRTIELVSGLLGDKDVSVEDFATSSLMGLRGSQDRLMLIGGHCGLALFGDDEGKQLQSRQDTLMWSPLVRLNEKLEEVENSPYGQCKEGLLHMKSQFTLGKCMATFAESLDQLACRGSLLALEMAHDIAFDLVQLATHSFRQVNAQELTIGLYGQVLLGSETIRSRVKYLLRLLFPHCPIVDAPLAPAMGAYLSSLLTRRTDLSAEMITNLCT